MKEVIKNGKVLARHILKEDIQEGLNFYSKDEEFIQVGAWSYPKDKELLAHVHNEVERKINRTYEALYIIQGSLEAEIYDLEEKPVEKLLIQKGDILILLESGHGYHILEDNTKVLEIKNGPYLGAEIDRHRI
ncbi:hypothetical protein [Eubacterium limosum]|uniref:hypothetical protein n=1 Tax=Eubacterium limosum TaxID=1736 RepID=UPI0022E031B3|nr:hypothetical protein [Eubacterium limosum]